MQGINNRTNSNLNLLKSTQSYNQLDFSFGTNYITPMSECNNRHGIINLVTIIREKSNTFIEHEFKKRGINGILTAHTAILGFLYCKQEPVTISELVEVSNRVKSTVTIMIKTLEKHGYIQKQKCQNDGRVSYISLTKRGKEIENDFMEVTENGINKMFASIGENEIDSTYNILEKIEKNL